MNRLTVATVCALLVGLFAVSTASAAPDRPATPPPTDYWQKLGFLNMAHQGGELEAPGNTLYAFKTAMKYRGADTLEMDGYVTADDVFVVTHDMRPAGTSDAPNDASHEIRDLTLDELRAYDFGYKFSPGKGHYNYDAADPHPYRGIATGAEEPPTGYSASDFQIATFEQVLAAFPDTPINIDMKSFSGDPSVTLAAADALAKIMNNHPERSEDVIVASFSQASMEKFHELAPSHKALSGSLDATVSYVTGNPLVPTPVAVQPPDIFNFGGNDVRTIPILKPGADYDGFAIHVWGSDSDPAQESDSFYAKLIEEGADGFFTQEPSKLHQYLCEAGIARPDGSPRCSSQVCPEGQEGIAPESCKDIPVEACPPDTTGTRPFCAPVVTPPPPKAEVKKLSFAKVKGKTKAGKKRKLKLKIRATEGSANWVKVRLKSSNRRKVKVRKYVKAKLKPGKTVKKVITLRSTRKAKGKVKITASSGSAKASANPLYKAKGQSGSNPIHNG
ncbi:MAG: hypothetical protein IPK93_03550 [Solirubrobacterales bacterium]|nr:hypothetical protein [Solirubrobacterales bacterium]